MPSTGWPIVADSCRVLPNSVLAIDSNQTFRNALAGAAHNGRTPGFRAEWGESDVAEPGQPLDNILNLGEAGIGVLPEGEEFSIASAGLDLIA